VKALPSGAVVELLATDAGSIKDVAAWCRATGNELIEQTSDGAVFRFAIRRK
jgi:tRNA 2-thiouridine synthesizing protein A